MGFLDSGGQGADAFTKNFLSTYTTLNEQNRLAEEQKQKLATQQQQQQMKMQAQAHVADTVGKAATAANTLSQTDVGQGQTALSAILGTGGNSAKL